MSDYTGNNLSTVYANRDLLWNNEFNITYGIKNLMFIFLYLYEVSDIFLL